MTGGEGLDTKKKVRLSRWQYMYFASGLFLVLVIIFSWYSTLDLLELEDRLEGVYAEKLELRELLEQDLESLKNIVARSDLIKADQDLMEMALPFEPRQDQVVALLEYIIHRIKERHFINEPENISWRKLSEDDIPDDAMSELEIHQYSVSMEGSYEALMDFFRLLRESVRFMDVRSISGFTMDLNGLVQLDLSLWVYNISSLNLESSARLAEADDELVQMVVDRLEAMAKVPGYISESLTGENFGRENLFFPDKKEDPEEEVIE